jgi:hypothetical protein
MDIARHLESRIDLADDGLFVIRAYLEKVEKEPEQGVEFSLEFSLNRAYTRIFVLHEVGKYYILSTYRCAHSDMNRTKSGH